MAESRSGKGASNRFERHPRLTLSMVLLVSIGMVLVGAEMIAQWAYPSPPSPEYRVPHPRFGWVLVPGASYINHIAGELCLLATMPRAGVTDHTQKTRPRA